MHSRSEWTTRAPAFSPARKNVIDIFIHHEGGGIRGQVQDKPAVLRQIELYVIPKGYIAIDYNVMVFNDGDVWAGRGVENEDGATINNNPTSVSICAVGNYELEPCSDALVKGIQQAIREIVASGYSVTDPHIRIHKEVFGTACPGKNLIARINEIKNWKSITDPPKPTKPVGGNEEMHFIQVKKTGKAIASSNGQTKNIFGSEDEYNTAVWCAAVQGSQNPKEVILVSQKYWDSLPTLT